MKRYLTLLALIASPAMAQTTQCYQLGQTINCNTYPATPIAQPSQDLTPMYQSLLNGSSYQAGYAQAQRFTHEQYCAGVRAQGLPPMRGC